MGMLNLFHVNDGPDPSYVQRTICEVARELRGAAQGFRQVSTQKAADDHGLLHATETAAQRLETLLH